MSIFRISKDKENPYVMINKIVLQDESLSWKARGLMGYLLSLPDDWVIYLSELEKHSQKDGHDSLASGVKELIEFGYIVRERIRSGGGTFSTWSYTVYESPHLTTNGFSSSGLTISGEPPTTNTHGTKNDYTKRINNKKKKSETKGSKYEKFYL